MDNIKSNPIKYVKLFSLIFIIASFVTRIIFQIVIVNIYSGILPLANILSIILYMIPDVLFVIYAYKFYGTNRTQALLPLSYIVSIILSFISITQSIKTVRYITYYSSVAQAFKYGAAERVMNFVFDVVALVFSIILMITCLNNFKTLKIAKKIIIINAGLSIFSFLIGIIIDLVAGYRINVLTAISFIIFLISLLSHISYIIFWNFAVEKRNVSPLENDLIKLKEKYNNGVITEEEYNQRKTEILNKL